jgi:type II secretory pathway pseudopilin PulG
MNLALKLFLKCQPRQQSKVSQTTDGFTMIELLIGTIMAFLIITPLLGFVVSVLNDDTREQAKSATDFEQQAAISFISEDLGQAYYIYSRDKEITLEDGSTQEIDEITQIKGVLPRAGEDPILVFWKQQTIPNSIPFSSDIDPKDCEPDTCDDTTVRALVSYYLIQEDSKIWCQPEGGDCPQRIIRYVMKEDLEKYRGTGVGFESGQLDPSQQGNVVFDPEFSLDDPTKNIIEKEIKKPQGEVLINYVSDFKVSNVPATSDSATIKIQSDGLRRNDAGKSCEADKTSAFCPKATVTVTGLSLERN